jgi:tetratricopeptide (TPR) repeat protein
VIPDDIRANDLHPAARNELKTLQADVQERVARHLAMVAMLIDEDPELAHQHALSASRRAGRIPVARETLAITAYRTGDFALALRELRTYRRLSGLDGHLALMVDCERGLGRPEKALETGLEADTSKLDTEQRVHLAIAMSGARLDLGQTQQALFELEIPELNPQRAFSWSPELFGAYAAVLEDLGRDDEAREWYRHADRAAGALQDHLGSLDQLEVFEIHESEFDLEEASDDEDPADVDARVEGAAEESEQRSDAADDTRPEEDAVAPAEAEPEAGAAIGDAAAPAGEDEGLSAPDAEDEIAAEVAELLAEAGIREAERPESAEDRS